MIASLFRKVKRRLFNLPNLYRLPTGPTRQLSHEAIQNVEMRAPNPGESQPNGALFKIWKDIPKGHKWWHYFPAYESVLGEYRNKPVRFLEIGVYQGGSLAMWKKYFHPESVIVGIDIDPGCAKFDDASSNVHVRIGDQSDKQFLRKVIEEFGPFDVILDDGSHFCSHMIKTFDYAFLNGLTPKGMYIAEDTHSNFWLNWRDQSYSFIDLCKDLVDFSHSHYTHAGLKGFTFGHDQCVSAISVPRIGAEIQEIRFLDSIIIITRNKERCLPVSQHL